MDSLMVACENCKFFQPGGDHKDGECRYGPPDVYYHPMTEPTSRTTVFDDDMTVETEVWEDNTYVGWPTVNRHDWCGAHKPRTSE